MTVTVRIVAATGAIRKMRGGTQAHLLEGSDGGHYVVKFLNNPQHRRILVNEFLSSIIIGHLGLQAPAAAFVTVTEGFLLQHPDVYLQLKSGRIRPTAGLHFGSAYPGNPSKTAVYDFLPDTLLARVHNIDQFCGMLAFDKWMANTDARQAIFTREAAAERASGTPPPRNFVARFVDHGGAFDGPHWRFADSPRSGAYFRPTVYRCVESWADFEPWLERIKNLPEATLTLPMQQLPASWLDTDERELGRLMERLQARRARVPDLLGETIKEFPAAFPNWKLKIAQPPVNWQLQADLH